jgi:hypothetical protein
MQHTGLFTPLSMFSIARTLVHDGFQFLSGFHVINYVRLLNADVKTWSELISSDFRCPGGLVLNLTLTTPSRTEETRRLYSEFRSDVFELEWGKSVFGMRRITYHDVT